MLNEQEGEVSPDLSHVEDSKIEEKLIPQSEVNRLVGTVKQKALEKGYQKAMEELKANQAPLQQPPLQQPSLAQPSMQQPEMAQPQMGQQQIPSAVPSNFQEQIKQAIQAEREEQLRQKHLEMAETSKALMAHKLQAAKSKYPDFDNVMQNINLNNPLHEQLLHGANDFDNGADVLYDLAKNPEKLSMLSMHLMTQNPNVAYNQMKSLSESIKTNANAHTQPQPPAPLAQIQPTPTGAGSGQMTLADAKRMFRR